MTTNVVEKVAGWWLWRVMERGCRKGDSEGVHLIIRVRKVGQSERRDGRLAEIGDTPCKGHGDPGLTELQGVAEPPGAGDLEGDEG